MLFNGAHTDSVTLNSPPGAAIWILTTSCIPKRVADADTDKYSLISSGPGVSDPSPVYKLGRNVINFLLM